MDARVNVVDDEVISCAENLWLRARNGATGVPATRPALHPGIVAANRPVAPVGRFSQENGAAIEARDTRQVISGGGDAR